MKLDPEERIIAASLDQAELDDANERGAGADRVQAGRSCQSDDHHFARAALQANQPIRPGERRRFSALPLGLLAGIGLDLILAGFALDDGPDLFRGGGAFGAVTNSRPLPATRQETFVASGLRHSLIEIRYAKRILCVAPSAIRLGPSPGPRPRMASPS